MAGGRHHEKTRFSINRRKSESPSRVDNRIWKGLTICGSFLSISARLTHAEWSIQRQVNFRRFYHCVRSNLAVNSKECFLPFATASSVRKVYMETKDQIVYQNSVVQVDLNANMHHTNYFSLFFFIE